ncbi:DUF5134 domain-containing protein [Kitasatospora viridis]|uniref:Uncharacterized protein DUF5134 n=1 Tax=Kitasatospora viridis TaxID=281105 RepID=A0A561UNZ8_9ACTN|nr:DUF5134 domain-containing protein [Kitasatospora viridis]TWG01079.1 uncharacterized protein DUF5134 [Kitasatospora viridis]
MHGPVVLSVLLALLTAATGTLCLLRMRTGGARHGSRGSDAAEAAMGLGTAAMITLGDRLPAPLWVVLFGLLGAASVAAALAPGAVGRRAHRLHHAVGAAAMAYMALAMRGPDRHPGMAMPMGLPLLTGLLLLYFGCYALWSGSRLLTAGGPVAGPAGGPVPQACRLAMGVGMFAMLLAL